MDKLFNELKKYWGLVLIAGVVVLFILPKFELFSTIPSFNEISEGTLLIGALLIWAGLILLNYFILFTLFKKYGFLKTILIYGSIGIILALIGGFGTIADSLIGGFG